MAGQQGGVGGNGLAGLVPRPGVDDRRRAASVVEQCGSPGEALHTHQFLGVEAAVGGPELGVTLGWDAADGPVVRHRCLLLASAERTSSSEMLAWAGGFGRG